MSNLKINITYKLNIDLLNKFQRIKAKKYALRKYDRQHFINTN